MAGAGLISEPVCAKRAGLCEASRFLLYVSASFEKRLGQMEWHFHAVCA
jgi:hypothetical protein